MTQTEELLKQIKRSQQKGQITETIALYETLCIQSPDNAAAHNNLASLYVQKNQYQKALKQASTLRIKTRTFVFSFSQLPFDGGKTLVDPV